jgi:2-methylcitrate dehydratase
MTSTADIAGFAADVTRDRLPDDVREAAKRRLLDAVAVGLHEREAAVTSAIRTSARESPTTTDESRLWGSIETTTAPTAAMGNAAAIVAGNGPTFLAPTLAPIGAPIAAVVAAAEARAATGEATLAGLAAALEVHGELAWNAPLDESHPATHAAVAATAGVGRVIGLDSAAIEAAVGAAASRIALDLEGEPYPALAGGIAARSAIHACRLAAGGVDAPDALAAPNGWHDRVGAFDLDFDPGCERVREAAILPHDAYPHEQTAVTAAIELSTTVPLDPADVDAVTVDVVEEVAPNIDTGRIATALVDRDLSIHRGVRTGVAPIADATTVSVDETLADRTETGLPAARVTVETHDDDERKSIADRFVGHPAAPASWGTVEEKFRVLADERHEPDRLDTIVETVRGFEAEGATELARLLD